MKKNNKNQKLSIYPLSKEEALSSEILLERVSNLLESGKIFIIPNSPEESKYIKKLIKAVNNYINLSEYGKN